MATRQAHQNQAQNFTPKGEELGDDSASEELGDDSTSEELGEDSGSELGDDSASELDGEDSGSEELGEDSISELDGEDSGSEELGDDSASEELDGDGSTSEELLSLGVADESVESLDEAEDPDAEELLGDAEDSESVLPLGVAEGSVSAELPLVKAEDSEPELILPEVAEELLLADESDSPAVLDGVGDSGLEALLDGPEELESFEVLGIADESDSEEPSLDEAVGSDPVALLLGVPEAEADDPLELLAEADDSDPVALLDEDDEPDSIELLLSEAEWVCVALPLVEPEEFDAAELSLGLTEELDAVALLAVAEEFGSPVLLG
ncbi:hypothetical protein IW146_000169 [Coemansia sp. RSA 922]|nr:hypothetical protein IW146_000169 [Coemansia sp. RSA 922]